MWGEQAQHSLSLPGLGWRTGKEKGAVTMRKGLRRVTAGLSVSTLGHSRHGREDPRRTVPRAVCARGTGLGAAIAATQVKESSRAARLGARGRGGGGRGGVSAAPPQAALPASLLQTSGLGIPESPTCCAWVHSHPHHGGGWGALVSVQVPQDSSPLG